MRTTLITTTIVISFVFSVLTAGFVNAQNLGLRFGYGAELSYQHLMGDNRLEVDLGLSNFSGALNLAATYQWVKPLENKFNWYYGFGAGIGIWDQVFGLAALGQVGIEYNFDGPIQLSLDWRPGLHFIFYNADMYTGFWGSSVALSIRYRLK
jgi:hypothetical protein